MDQAVARAVRMGQTRIVHVYHLLLEDEDEKSPISKILMRNVESIKKIAEREGISLNKLIKHFKESE
jgi:SNF2 family DNA or RNA helicase